MPLPKRDLEGQKTLLKNWICSLKIGLEMQNHAGPGIFFLTNVQCYKRDLMLTFSLNFSSSSGSHQRVIVRFL